jgi:hypothetical protein
MAAVWRCACLAMPGPLAPGAQRQQPNLQHSSMQGQVTCHQHSVHVELPLHAAPAECYSPYSTAAVPLPWQLGNVRSVQHRCRGHILKWTTASACAWHTDAARAHRRRQAVCGQIEDNQASSTWAGGRRRHLPAALAPDGGDGGGVRRRPPPGRLLPLQLRRHVHVQQRAARAAEARGRRAVGGLPKVFRGRL